MPFNNIRSVLEGLNASEKRGWSFGSVVSGQFAHPMSQISKSGLLPRIRSLLSN